MLWNIIYLFKSTLRSKSNLRPRQMKVNTVTRLRQDIKHLRHWNKSESRSCRQDRVKNESDSDTFKSTSQSKQHWEWDESDPELAYTAETGPSQMTCKTETRVKAARRLKQVKVKTPKTPSHVRTKKHPWRLRQVRVSLTEPDDNSAPSVLDKILTLTWDVSKSTRIYGKVVGLPRVRRPLAWARNH